MNDDAALPGSEVLLGAGSQRLLAPAVAAAGARLLGLRASQVRFEPGRRLVVRYAAEVEDAAGNRSTETLCAVAQSDSLPEGIPVVDVDGANFGVWRYPHDPWLPGLRQVASPRGVRALLAALDLATTVARVAPVVYRPGRRAVLRVTANRGELYLKVVRPGGKASRLQALHATFGSQVAVPRCLAADDALGVVVFEALCGKPLTRPLVDRGSLPAPAAIAALVKRVQTVQLPHNPPRAANSIDHQAAVLRFAVPDERDRIARLVDAARDESGADLVSAHGDFYERQILVDDAGEITGLLDLDAARTASATHDPATLIGHLIGLAHVHPKVASRINAYRRELEDQFADVGDLRPAVLGVLLGLAATPFRRQSQDWVAKVSAWLDVAEGATASV